VSIKLFWSAAFIKANTAFLIKQRYERFLRPFIRGRLEEFFIPFVTFGSRKVLLCPNYIFFKIEEDFDYILWKAKEPFIKKFFFNGEGKLYQIPDYEIEKFKENCSKYSITCSGILEEGKFVRITKGVFAGFLGVIKKIDRKKDKVFVMLENFKVSIWIGMESLEIFYV